jgi:hypothetical protein
MLATVVTASHMAKHNININININKKVFDENPTTQTQPAIDRCEGFEQHILGNPGELVVVQGFLIRIIHGKRMVEDTLYHKF